MHLNYPKPSPLTPSPWKNYFPQKVRDHCSKTHTYTQHTVFLSPYLSLLLLENFKNFWKSFCCRKVDPFQVLSNTQKWIVRGDTSADKARDFIGKGHPGGEQQGKGTQENCSATWLTVSGFMVMGLVSRWSLAHHSDSESFLVAHTSLSQDGC